MFFMSFFGGLEYVGHSFAYVVHFVFLRYVWSCRSKRRTTFLASHLHLLYTYLGHKRAHSPYSS
jgi:hypothetical protein